MVFPLVVGELHFAFTPEDRPPLCSKGVCKELKSNTSGHRFTQCIFFVLWDDYIYLDRFFPPGLKAFTPLIFFQPNLCCLYQVFYKVLNFIFGVTTLESSFPCGLKKPQRAGMASLVSSRSSIVLIVLYSSGAAEVCSSPKDYVRRAKLDTHEVGGTTYSNK